MTHVSLRFVRLSPIGVRTLLLLIALTLGAAASFAQITEDTVVTLTVTRPPAVGGATLPITQSFIQSPPPGGISAATAVLIMLPGNYGTIQLSPSTTTPGDGTLDVNSGHFVARSRWLFASQGFLVLTLDAATDFQLLPDGLEDQQSNPAHIIDVLQVINYARTMISTLPPNTPVWLVGTGRGAAGGAWTAGQNPSPTGPDGLVFMSPVNISGDPDSLLSAPLTTITVPTLIFSNEASVCPDTLYTGDPAVKKMLTAAPVKTNKNINDAGFPALSTDCLSLSPQGYFGIEPSTVTKISNWIISPS
jgi:hypothetical protein